MSVLSLSKQHEELQHVIDQLNAETKKPSDNRRRRPRREITMQLWVYLLGVPQTPRVKVHTRNISVSGISFLSKRSFPLGTIVATELNLNGKSPKMLLTKVLFCRYVRQGHFQIGAEFVAALDGGFDAIPAQWIAKATEATMLEKLMKT